MNNAFYGVLFRFFFPSLGRSWVETLEADKSYFLSMNVQFQHRVGRSLLWVSCFQHGSALFYPLTFAYFPELHNVK